MKALSAIQCTALHDHVACVFSSEFVIEFLTGFETLKTVKSPDVVSAFYE
jgi:hypothetical protein